MVGLMEPEAYVDMATHEDTHWWFVGRRRAIATVLRSMALSPETRILEVGCGTGGNLELLAGFGALTAIEPNPYARARAHEKSPATLILDGSLPGELPPDLGSFDLIVLLDVLEHVADDAGSLAALAEHLAPGGRVLITVPAHRWLWSAHDRRLHHLRRYARRDLVHLIAGCGLRVELLSPFNTVLAPLAVASRLAERLGVAPADQESVPPRMLNEALARIFAGESALLRRSCLPFGQSWMALVGREPCGS